MIALILAFLLACVPALAEKDFSAWSRYTKGSLVRETTGFVPGQVGTAGFKITLVKDWHTYWVNPGDSGAPIRLKFKPGPGLKVQNVLFPFPERVMTGPLVSFAYSNENVFPIEIMVSRDLKPGQSVSLEVDAEWLVCADVCIPAFANFQMEIPIRDLADVRPTEEFSLFQAARARVPQMIADYPRLEFKAEGTTLALPKLNAGEKVHEFFPFRGSGVSNAEAKVVGSVLQLEKGVVPQDNPERVGVLVVRQGSQMRALQLGESGWSFESLVVTDPLRIWWMLLSAFLGGLILNLMPCVFPILSMKFLSLLKLGQAHRQEVRTQNLAYVVGVVISFLAIAGVLSGLRAAGQLVGWGFQLQSPIFLALLIWLFIALTMNLLGVFEIDFIDSGMGGRLTRMGGVSGSFFTGVLAVIVASPCTAPFMGAALGFGVSQPLPILFGVFLMIGLGLAFPYLLFAVFPSWTRFLPRPGVWMERLKQVMALPMLATAGWLVWVMSQVNQIQTVYGVLGCGALLAVALWLRGKGRIVVGVVTVLGMVGMIGWIATAPMKASGIESADSGPWEAFSEAKLNSLKGKNVFVNMTADWCLSCKVNERLVFSDPEVLAALQGKNVVMLKGDWTQRDEEITRFLTRYDRVGVPFYVLYSPKSPGGVTLPEVLTKSMFLDWIKSEYP